MQYFYDLCQWTKSFHIKKVYRHSAVLQPIWICMRVTWVCVWGWHVYCLCIWGWHNTLNNCPINYPCNPIWLILLTNWILSFQTKTESCVTFIHIAAANLCSIKSLLSEKIDSETFVVKKTIIFKMLPGWKLLNNVSMYPPF